MQPQALDAHAQLGVSNGPPSVAMWGALYAYHLLAVQHRFWGVSQLLFLTAMGPVQVLHAPSCANSS